MRWGLLTAVATAGCIFATAGHADLYKITLHGTVSGFNLPLGPADTPVRLFPDIQLGDSATFSVIYDSATSGIDLDAGGIPNRILSYPSSSHQWSAQMGLFSATGTGGRLGVQNNFLNNHDGFNGDLSPLHGTYVGSPTVNDYPLFFMSFSLFSNNLSMLNSTALPTGTFTGFDSDSRVTLLFESGLPGQFNVDYTATASITSFAIEPLVAPVPLPAALPLFMTGLGLMGLVGWRRKRKAPAAA